MEAILDKKQVDYTDRTPDTPAGSVSALSMMTLFQNQLPQLKRVIAGLNLGREDAQDILQDVSIEFLSGKMKCQNKVSAAAWLCRVTINKCLSEHRRRRRFKKASAKFVELKKQNKTPAKTPDENAIQKEQLKMIRKALKNLDDSLSAPLVLRYFCDCNSAKIAEILNLNPSTVRSRLRDARILLAKTLMKEK